MNKKKGKTFINEFLSFLEKSQSPCATTVSLKSVRSPTKEENDEKQQQIVIRKKDMNLIRRVSKLSPVLSLDHIDIFFGMLPINSKAIENPGYEESYLYTYMHGRQVDRVYMYENAVVFQMTEPELSPHQPPTQYLVQKYKSKNKREFYEFAQHIQELSKVLIQMGAPKPAESELIKKYLDILGNRMYITIFGPRKLAISNSLLTYLEYDVEQVALQAAKYRCLTFEVYSSLKYSPVKAHIVKSFQYAAELAIGKLSLEEYNKFTTYELSDFIQSKNHVLSYCDMKLYFLTPNYFVNEVVHIHYKKDEINRKKTSLKALQQQVISQRDRILQEEYKVIQVLKKVPKGLFAENQKIIAGYKELDTTESKESNGVKEQ